MASSFRELTDGTTRPTRVRDHHGETSPWERRTTQWTHPLHGVVRLAGTSEPQPVTRIADACALLADEGVIGGWASAHQQGVVALDGLGPGGGCLDVLLYAGPGHQLRRRPGIEPSRAVLPEDEVLHASGRALTGLSRCALDEMCRAPSVVEAVVALDCMLSRVSRGPSTTADEVADLLRRHSRLRGAPTARAALPLGSDRSASKPETRLRLRGRALGLTELKVNWPVFGPGGRLVGIVDLVDEESGLVLEYDGEDHGRLGVRDRDHARQDELELINLSVARFTAMMSRRPADTDRRICAAHERASARDRGRDAWSTRIPDR